MSIKGKGKPCPGRQLISDRRISQIMQMHAKGYNYSEIGRELNMHPDVIGRFVRGTARISE